MSTPCVTFHKKLFLRRGIVSFSPNPQAGGPPLLGCSRLIVQYVHSYPPHLQSVSSTRNSTRHAVVKGDRITWGYLPKTHKTLVVNLSQLIPFSLLYRIEKLALQTLPSTCTEFVTVRRGNVKSKSECTLPPAVELPRCIPHELRRLICRRQTGRKAKYTKMKTSYKN